MGKGEGVSVCSVLRLLLYVGVVSDAISKEYFLLFACVQILGATISRQCLTFFPRIIRVVSGGGASATVTCTNSARTRARAWALYTSARRTANCDTFHSTCTYFNRTHTPCPGGERLLAHTHAHTRTHGRRAAVRTFNSVDEPMETPVL